MLYVSVWLYSFISVVYICYYFWDSFLFVIIHLFCFIKYFHFDLCMLHLLLKYLFHGSTPCKSSSSSIVTLALGPEVWASLIQNTTIGSNSELFQYNQNYQNCFLKIYPSPSLFVFPIWGNSQTQNFFDVIAVMLIE